MKNLPLVLVSMGCGADLPEGWEGAQPVSSLVQAECHGDPYEPFDESVDADLVGDPVVVRAWQTHFRCAQDVEGFWRQNGGQVDVLVQPVDMNPKQVAGCDCLYDLTIELSADEPPLDLAVYRRWDHLNEPNPTVLIGEFELPRP